MDKYEQLARLKTLRDEGTLSDEEFEKEKSRIMAAEAGATGAFKPWGMDVDQFCMFLHLAQAAGVVVPGAGLVLPIVMWAMHKDDDVRIDAHGKVVLNWMISSLIYVTVSSVLIVVLIGFLLLAAWGVAAVVFMILGALKASKGELWKYPLSIPFLDVPPLPGRVESRERRA